MTDYSINQPAVKSKLIKTGLLSQPLHQQAGFKPKPSLLKQPLSSINTNYILNQNNCNVNNNYERQQQLYRTRTLSSQRNARNGNEAHLSDGLSDDALKTNVQIVLNNLQNALLKQEKTHHDTTYQDRFQYLNIFGEQSPPSTGGAFPATNQRNCHYQNLRKMSTSPAECDNTNNNMGPASMLGCSFASDFTHDNSDYQWFVDYGWATKFFVFYQWRLYSMHLISNCYIGRAFHNPCRLATKCEEQLHLDPRPIVALINLAVISADETAAVE